MSEPGFASLGPTLLARKGGAKPAMRPQLPPLVQDEQELAALADEQLEDLGWNDMGSDDNSDFGSDSSMPAGSADVVPINGSIAADDFAQALGPIVRRHQRRLEERVLADAAMSGPEDSDAEYDDEDEGEELYGIDRIGHQGDAAAQSQPELNVAATPAPRASRIPAAQSGRRAAFTLRLDAERHLKLRLAATMRGVSAQVLVTEALDAMLAELDDLEVITNHLQRH